MLQGPGYYYNSPNYRSGGGGGRPLRGSKDMTSKTSSSTTTTTTVSSANGISLEEDFVRLAGKIVHIGFDTSDGKSKKKSFCQKS